MRHESQRRKGHQGNREQEDMKRVELLGRILPMQMNAGISFVWLHWRRQKLPLVTFVLLCLNLVLAPAVYAAADGTLERRYAWAVGVLILLTLVLAGYLFVVVFQPERF
jgi:K+-transporting ATPase KdpF subunit